ncbi:MAG: extracellular solute-binding protein [Desulfitobacteriaceae bacterium]|nr:extracellular solute-binding protein [Desulfitobacteriaceae bacterium]MDD4400442.1 extracellular solute-binding protein [Desulfitobacteriaceae bacterium]
MKKRYLLIISLLILFTLSGCLKAVPKGEGGEEAPAVVAVWHTLTGAEAEALQVKMQDLSKAKPEVFVKLVYVPEQIFVNRAYQAEAGGEGPEIFLAPKDILLQLYAQGLLAPVVEVASEGFPAAVAQFRFSGNLYAQPWLTDVPLLYFRKDKVPIPADLTSFSITKGRFVLPEINSLLLSTWWNGQGGQLAKDGKPTLNYQANLSFLQQLKSWRISNALQVTPNAMDQFAKGQASYTIGWASQAQVLTQLNIPWDSIPMSDLLGGKGQALLGPTLGIANSTTKTIKPLNSSIQIIEQALLNPAVEGAVAQAGHRFPANPLYYSAADKLQGIETQVNQVLTGAWPLEGGAVEWKLFSLQDSAWKNAFAGMLPLEALDRAQTEAVRIIGET